MIELAVKLYRAKEQDEMNALRYVLGNGEEPTHRRGKFTSSQVWFWAKRRWGMRFAHLEYNERECQ